MKTGNKQKNKAFFLGLKKKKDGNHTKAAPVIITNNRNEIALIMQDNAPVWRVFGNGFTDKPSKKYNPKGMYYHHAKRILSKETNLPYKLVTKMKPILRYDIICSDKNVRFESNRVFVLQIGDFPLESRKGAFVVYFNMSNRPINMNSNHGELFDLAVKQLKYGHGMELFTAVGNIDCRHHNPRMAIFEEVLKKGLPITGLEQWKYHPNVVKNRLEGKLLFDP